MIEEWMTLLATSGASALVGAAATDAWQGARDGIVHLFRRGGPRRQELAGGLLDADARSVEQADPADRDQVRHQLLPAWSARLADLVWEFSGDAGGQSGVATELDRLARSVQAQLPAQQQAWVQNNVARDNGRVFAAQGGDVHYHEGPALSLPQRPGAG